MKTIQIKEFNDLNNYKEVVLEIENYKGNTIQGFKLKVNDTNDLVVEDIYDEDSKYKNLSDLNIYIKNNENNIQLFFDKYDVADIDGDYLFETECDLIRLQEKEIDSINGNMVKLVKAENKDMEFVSSFNLKALDNVYLIEFNREIVGVIEYTQRFEPDGEDMQTITRIEYIDILKEYRRKGIATLVIDEFRCLGEYYIYGDAIPSSIEFWKSLNAEFEGEDEDIEYYIENGTCLPFFI